MSRPADRLLDLVALAHAVVLGAFVPVVTRLPLPRQAELLQWHAGRRSRRPPLALAETERIVRAVERAQRRAGPVVARGCLTRSLVLYWLLGRGDERVQLCFGAGRIEGQFCGHAWLTKDGQPYLERVDPTTSFRVTYRIPVPRPGGDRPAPATTT